MPDPGPINAPQLEGFGNSGTYQIGSVLMSDGAGNCVWVYIPGLIDGIDAGDSADAWPLTIDAGGASDSWPSAIDGGDA